MYGKSIIQLARGSTIFLNKKTSGGEDPEVFEGFFREARERDSLFRLGAGESRRL